MREIPRILSQFLLFIYFPYNSFSVRPGIFYNHIMRLWTINPEYLDPQGLVALWREALLAKKVLEGKTKGYKNHPQLIRFKNTANPVESINAYLTWVYRESRKRGYSFKEDKFINIPQEGIIQATKGQLLFEWQHLLRKLKIRNRDCYTRWRDLAVPEHHPLFLIIPGEKEPWEKGL